jgi:hypothetical protein
MKCEPDIIRGEIRQGMSLLIKNTIVAKPLVY